MSKKYDKEEFVEKSKLVHGNKYDYSEVEYIDAHTKVNIICPEHGSFYQMPYSHLQGFGCNKCIKRKLKYDTNDIVNKFKKVHGDKYDYSKVDYKGSKGKVCIICKEHGEFYQLPKDHIRGCGCQKCVGLFKSNTEDFVKKAKSIHGEKYDYSKVEYVNARTKVCIICPEHGEFYQIPNSHLNGEGCKLCVKPIHDTESFIEKAKNIHGDKYDYSKVKYVDYNTKVCIICPIHGEFYQSTSDHLKTNGCARCGGVAKLTTEEFVKKAKEVHGDKYDYSKVNYIDANTKVCIICPVHGEFYQTPSSHVNLGRNCPVCNESRLENEIAQLLDEYGIEYERQKRFKWLRWQSLDFYLPLYQIGIECQGKQHFEPIDFFGGDTHFEYVKKLDIVKNSSCRDNNINLLYYTNVENVKKDNYIIYKDNLFNDKQKLMEEIKNGKIC